MVNIRLGKEIDIATMLRILLIIRQPMLHKFNYVVLGILGMEWKGKERGYPKSPKKNKMPLNHEIPQDIFY